MKKSLLNKISLLAFFITLGGLSLIVPQTASAQGHDGGGCTEIIILGDVEGDVTIITGSDNDVSSGGGGKTTIVGAVEDVIEWIGGLFKKKKKKDDGETEESSSSSSSSDPQLNKFLNSLEIADIRVNASGVYLKVGNDQEQCSLGMNLTKPLPVPAIIVKGAGLSGKQYFKAGKYKTNSKGILFLPFRK